MKKCLLSYNLENLKDIIAELKEKSFRAGQIFKALHLGLDFFEMTEISKTLRDRLSEDFIAQPVQIIKNLKSVDGTEKFLFKLYDGNVVEGELSYGDLFHIIYLVLCHPFSLQRASAKRNQ